MFAVTWLKKKWGELTSYNELELSIEQILDKRQKCEYGILFVPSFMSYRVRFRDSEGRECEMSCGNKSILDLKENDRVRVTVVPPLKLLGRYSKSSFATSSALHNSGGGELRIDKLYSFVSFEVN